jgi:hypothetical protein
MEYVMTTFGFTEDEIDIEAPTRAARLKWVIVVDDSLDRGRAGNAIACIAAATSAGVAGLLGPDAVGPDGIVRPGLPWAGCSLLAGDPEDLRRVSARAHASEQEHVVDMPEAAQATRVYADYLARVRDDADPVLLAVGVVGPRNRVDKLTKGLQLLR